MPRSSAQFPRQVSPARRGQLQVIGILVDLIYGLLVDLQPSRPVCPDVVRQGV